MAVPARKFETELEMQAHTVLDEKVDHLQKDVTEIKSEVKRLSAEFVEHRVQTERTFAAVRTEIRDSIAAVRIALKGEIAALRNDMTAQIGALRVEMRDAIDQLRQTRSSQIAWLVGTVIGSVGAACAVVKLFLIPSADR
jgi:hypothetical protein